MNRFVDYYIKLAQGMGETETSELLAELDNSASEARKWLAASRSGVDDEYLIDLYTRLTDRGAGHKAKARRKEAVIEFEGLCQNASVPNDVLESFMQSRLERDTVEFTRSALGAFATYVQCRQPGAWFWDWWEEYLTREQEWDYSVVWEVVDIYSRKAGVDAAAMVAIVEQHSLWRVAEIYLQNWASGGQCQSWLKAAGGFLSQETTDVDGASLLLTDASYDWYTLARVYEQDEVRVGEIVNCPILSRMMMEMDSGDLGAMIIGALKMADEKVVLEALRLAHPRVWSNLFTQAIAGAFGDLRSSIQACILELAPSTIKNDLIGRLGQGTAIGRGGGNRDVDRRGHRH